MAKTAKAPRQVGGWTLVEQLGRGGNGTVFKATRGAMIGAIKVLNERPWNALRIARFQDEVEAMKRCTDIPGVLPVLDAFIPSLPSRDAPPWFVMGLASPIVVALGDKASLRNVVEAVRDIAHTLGLMHKRGISHRDIKPENLFLYERCWAVGDFGLAFFEGKSSETEKGERIGPIYYIAPEMLNEATTAAGEPADVYSLAKTLWVLVTGLKFPLPGQYDKSIQAFRLGAYVREQGTGPLDRLIEVATSFQADQRPPMQRFASELDAWLLPPVVRATGIQLDVSPFAAELDDRKLAIDAHREREQSLNAKWQEIGLRIRDRFRPLVIEIVDALTNARFDSVSANIDSYYWGFELYAEVPWQNGPAVRLKLTTGIDTSDIMQVVIRCRYELERLGASPGSVLLWDKQVSFLEGGSEEEVQVAMLDAAMRSELQACVTKVLSMSTQPQLDPGQPVKYSITVKDERGMAIAGVDVLLVGSNGTYLRANTDASGRVIVGPTSLHGVTVLFAHQDYAAKEVFDPKDAMEVILTRTDGLSSMVCISGWTSMHDLAGQVEFINDPHGRMYLYTQNIAVDGGKAQPVQITVGIPVLLDDVGGNRRSVVVRFVQGPCFLIETQSAIGR
jgi:serine/threonine protein kinase